MRVFPIFILVLTAGLACSKSPTACAECEDVPNAIRCLEQHFQYHQGVFYELDSKQATIFDLSGIDPFNDVFLIETDLIHLGNSHILISSEYGNYIFDSSARAIQKIEGADSPIFGLSGATQLYFKDEQVGDIYINDSTKVKNVLTSSTLFNTPTSGDQALTIRTFKSDFSHPDTLVIRSIYFPTETPGEEGFIALYEEEKHFVSVSNTTNRVRKVYEYTERTWLRFNQFGEVIEQISASEKIISQTKPERFTVTQSPIILAYQLGNQVRILDLENRNNIILDEARSPQISHDGNYITVTNFNEIDVYSIQSGQRFQISEKSDYSYYNPSTFLENEEAVIFVEKTPFRNTLNNVELKKVVITPNEVKVAATAFLLSDYIETDSLAYLITRASQPAVISDDLIFFLLFQHRIIASC